MINKLLKLSLQDDRICNTSISCESVISSHNLVRQVLKLAVAKVQNATDFRSFAPKIFDLGANLLLEFLKLILA